MKQILYKDLGLMDYQACWDLQEQVFKTAVDRKIARRNGEVLPEPENHLLFVEHPPVYTLGKSGSLSNLLLDEEALKEGGYQFYKINRGGDITYHGPGQLVVYPIFDLDQFFTDIHKYLRYLEEAVIRTLAEFGIEGSRYEGLTGVWIEPETPQARKICAMGVKCSRWVTMHGLALNVNTRLSDFGNIVPCGIDDKDVTSMERELGRSIDLQEVGGSLRKHLASLFEAKLVLAE